MNKYSKMRMRHPCVYKEHTKKPHAGRMENYEFNRGYVSNFLQKISPDSKSLENKMVGKWTELSKGAGLTGVGNGEQVNFIDVSFSRENHRAKTQEGQLHIFSCLICTNIIYSILADELSQSSRH